MTIHHLQDGRGPRHVYADGKQIHKVVYVDTAKGLIIFIPTPARISNRRIVYRAIQASNVAVRLLRAV